MTRCFLFCRRKVTALRFSVLCTLFRVSLKAGCEQGEEEAGNWQVERNNFLSGVVREHGRGEGSFPLPVLGKGGDQDLSDHCWCLLLL